MDGDSRRRSEELSVSDDAPALGPDDVDGDDRLWRPGIYRCPACAVVALVDVEGDSPRCQRRHCPAVWDRLV